MRTSDAGGESKRSHSNGNSKASCSSSSTDIVPQTPRRKTMDEVWNDINLATPSPDAAAADHHHSFRSFILQDLLAGAFRDPPSASAIGNLPQLHIPPTILSLSSSKQLGPGFNYPGFPPIPNSNVPPRAAASTFDPNGSFVSDRRHKRMVKNRESAARSRARKQAYANEMELEVAHLVKENSKLKKQNEELKLAMAAQNTKQKALQRTSSAPS